MLLGNFGEGARFIQIKNLYWHSYNSAYSDPPNENQAHLLFGNTNIVLLIDAFNGCFLIQRNK